MDIYKYLYGHIIQYIYCMSHELNNCRMACHE